MDYINLVIPQCEATLSQLDLLSQQLAVFHEILIRENQFASSDQDEILSDFWTKLGRNRSALLSLKHRFELLKRMGGYRDRAKEHVGKSLAMVLWMSETLEELRQRAVMPVLIGNTIPIDAQWKLIKASVTRMREDRERRLISTTT